MTRYLITGVDGFMGGGMKKFLALEEPSAEVVGIGRGSNLTDVSVCEDVFSTNGSFDYIFHFADVNGNAEWSMAHAADQFFANTKIGLNVLENIVRFQKQAKFVGFSSLWAYPELATNFRESDYWMGPLPEAIQHYGLSKKMLASGLAACAKQHGILGTMLVLGSVYGPGDHSDHLIPSLIAKMKNNRHELQVWGDGSQVRDFIFLDDQLRAIYLHKDYEGNLLNIAAGQPASVREVVGHLKDLMNYGGEIKYTSVTTSPPDDRRLDMSLATHYSGWPGRFKLKTLAEGLKITVGKGI